MKFSFLPEKVSKRYMWKFIATFIVMLVAVLAGIETQYPHIAGHTATPYINYFIVRHHTKNVVKSFQSPAPKHLLNLYEAPIAFGNDSQKQRVSEFHANIFRDGFVGSVDDDVNIYGARAFLIGEPMYFATAEEFLATKRGDCTENAIARYHVLLTAGYKTSVLLGYGIMMDSAHAVIAVHIEGHDYIADINYPDLILFDEWMESEQFILDYVLDKRGLHIYHGDLYPA
jgi:hypothetical protein